MSHPKKACLSWILVVVLVLETPDIRPFIRGTNSFKGLKPRRLRTSTTRVFGALDSGGNIAGG
jgi:hypothetical protein